MNNSPESQTMNRHVLEAISNLQDTGYVAASIEVIIGKIVPMMHRNDDFYNFQDNILNSLTLLKQVGLLSEPSNSAYRLCRCPVKSQSVPFLKRISRKTQMKVSKSKSAVQKNQSSSLAKTLRSSVLLAKTNGRLMCTECHTGLSTFLACRADLKAGRIISSLVSLKNTQPAQVPVPNGCNQNAAPHLVEPMETDVAEAPMTASRAFSFVSPYPI